MLNVRFNTIWSLKQGDRIRFRQDVHGDMTVYARRGDIGRVVSTGTHQALCANPGMPERALMVKCGLGARSATFLAYYTEVMRDAPAPVKLEAAANTGG